MLEIDGRDGLARCGEWSGPGGTMRVPNVLFLSEERINPPVEAEALLLTKRAESDMPSLSYGGSFFFPADERSAAIKGGLSLPGSMGRLQEWAAVAAGGEEWASVLHHSPSEPIGNQLVVMGNAMELLRHPRAFAERAVSLRRAAGYAAALYIPGIAAPANLALLAYCGADLMDSLRMVLDSRSRRMYSAGEVEADVDDPPGSCGCEACTEGGDGWLLRHNLSELHRELLRVRRTTARGNLRELVERRAVADPWTVAVLRHLDLRFQDHFEAHASMSTGTVRAYTEAALTRPDVVRFRDRMRERYRPPEAAEVLLLLPCSARKPYSLSRSHSRFRKAVKASGNPGIVHEVMVTSPLGIVPRELEVFPPAQHYDVPVTGDWSADEREVVARGLENLLKRHSYDAVVVHMSEEWMSDVALDAVVTSRGKPTSAESLERLREALSEALGGSESVRGRERLRQNLQSLARFQFGAAAESLLEVADVRGRYPNLRVWRDDSQLAMLVGSRGMLSLTLAGAEHLVRGGAYVVEIDDFDVKGNVFAVGVDAADPAIRIGDDVAVAHDGDLRAVGVARMTPGEMVEATRGEAVHVRHRVTR